MPLLIECPDDISIATDSQCGKESNECLCPNSRNVITPVASSSTTLDSTPDEANRGEVNPGFLEVNHALNQNDRPQFLENFSDPEMMRRTHKLSVDVDRLRVTYGYGTRAVEVLKGIDLTLPEGKIYGLLGPSGCGKTTLLRCIVGRQQPRSGQVRVFDQVPGTSGAFIPGPGVGYMPQDLTLYPEFNIYETLLFFGKMFRTPKKLLEERIKFLINFLDLPDKNRLVKNLSGGQQRRVSLAAALIHKPPLLILDEPTVGVDPLLRHAIWDYLVTLTQEEGMTIIVTTHYIEEARQANIVGLMRNGRMLAQNEPDKLLEDFQCETLEDVFLQLCLADKEGRAIVKQKQLLDIISEGTRRNNNMAKENSEISLINKVPSEVKYGISASAPFKINQGGFHTNTKTHDTMIDIFCRLLALVLKNLTRIKRNIPVLLFTFLVPSFQVVLFCLCIGAEPFELPMAIVNSEDPPLLSQRFLDTISNHTIIQRRFADLDEALSSVERGETWGVINIGDNFSSGLQYRMFLGIQADNETIEDSTIDIYMDMTNQQIGFILQKVIFESFIRFCEQLLTRLHRNTDLAQLPIRVRDPVYGNGKPSFTEFMAPGIILSITYIMAVGLTAISIIMETREGTMERCWVAGVRPFEVVISHVLSQCSVMIIQVALLLVFIFVVFKIPLEGSLTLVILLTLLQGLCGMTYGLVISSICSEEQSAMMLALGTFYPNLLLSGIIWPVQSMPSIIRYISYGLPQTIPTESLRSIMYRNWGIDHHEVWIGFVVSFVWTGVFLFFATTVFKYRK